MSRLPTAEDRSRALHQIEQAAANPPRDRASERRQAELNRRLVAFAESWNKLARSLTKGRWDARAARKARQAFQKLVNSPGWIEGGANSEE